MQTCMLSQAALADWKAHSIYSGERWAMGRMKYVPGDFALKGRLDASPRNTQFIRAKRTFFRLSALKSGNGVPPSDFSRRSSALAV